MSILSAIQQSAVTEKSELRLYSVNTTVAVIAIGSLAEEQFVLYMFFF